MKKMILFLTIFTLNSFALNFNEIPKSVKLSNKNGGQTDGTVWNSTMLKGKIHTLLYIDPDQRHDTTAILDAINGKKFDTKKHKLVAIINLASTWMPNALIETKLKSNQKDMPHMLYVFDKTKHLLKNWNLKDDSINVLIFDKNGKLIYQKSGNFNSAKIQNILKMIEQNINK